MGGVIVIDFDVIWFILFYMKEWIVVGNLDVLNVVNIDVGMIVYQMVQIVKQEGCNVIVDGILQNISWVFDLVGEFCVVRYQVEFYGMVVSFEFSYVWIYSWCEDQIVNFFIGFGWGVGDEFYFQVVKGYVMMVEVFQIKLVVNFMVFYFGDGVKVEIKFEGGVWVLVVFMKERLD